MKKLIFFLSAIIFFSSCVIAQNPLKRMPIPVQKFSALAGVTANPTITAWRFTGPMAGFMYPQNQVVTGLGYGYQRMHFVDSTQRYYTSFSISGVVYAGGNVTPSINPNNIISIGISAGLFNQLVMFGPCFNLPSAKSSGGSLGVVVNFSVPLN